MTDLTEMKKKMDFLKQSVGVSEKMMEEAAKELAAFGIEVENVSDSLKQIDANIKDLTSKKERLISDIEVELKELTARLDQISPAQ